MEGEDLDLSHQTLEAGEKTKVDLEMEESGTGPDLLSLIWLQPTSYILIILTIAITMLLAFEGVAIGGSAIYAIGGAVTFLFDFTAILLGIAALYILEELIFSFPVYNRLRFVITIRIISMLPGSVVGIALLLLFLSGTIPPAGIYPIIFMATLVLGTVSAASGIYYLRGIKWSNALLYAAVPGTIDLLLGLVVLLVNG